VPGLTTYKVRKGGVWGSTGGGYAEVNSEQTITLVCGGTTKCSDQAEVSPVILITLRCRGAPTHLRYGGELPVQTALENKVLGGSDENALPPALSDGSDWSKQLGHLNQRGWNQSERDRCLLIAFLKTQTL
jgi:hypothetical protein